MGWWYTAQSCADRGRSQCRAGGRAGGRHAQQSYCWRVLCGPSAPPSSPTLAGARSGPVLPLTFRSPCATVTASCPSTPPWAGAPWPPCSAAYVDGGSLGLPGEIGASALVREWCWHPPLLPLPVLLLVLLALVRKLAVVASWLPPLPSGCCCPRPEIDACCSCDWHCCCCCCCCSCDCCVGGG